MYKSEKCLVNLNAVLLHLMHNHVAWEMSVTPQQEHHILMSNEDYITIEISTAHRFHVNANIEFLATVGNKWQRMPHNRSSKHYSQLLHKMSVYFDFFSNCWLFILKASSIFIRQVESLTWLWLNGDPAMVCGLIEQSLDRKSHNLLLFLLHTNFTWKVIQDISFESALLTYKWGISSVLLRTLVPSDNNNNEFMGEGGLVNLYFCTPTLKAQNILLVY